MHRFAFRIAAVLSLAVILASPAAQAAPRVDGPAFEHGLAGVWQALGSWLADRMPGPWSSWGSMKVGPADDPDGRKGGGSLPPTAGACGLASCTDAGPEWDPHG